MIASQPVSVALVPDNIDPVCAFSAARDVQLPVGSDLIFCRLFRPESAAGDFKVYVRGRDGGPFPHFQFRGDARPLRQAAPEQIAFVIVARACARDARRLAFRRGVSLEIHAPQRLEKPLVD